MPGPRSPASIGEREFAGRELGVVGDALGLRWTLRGVPGLRDAIGAPHPEASALVEPLIGLLVSQPVDRPQVRVEMAKDDRPRQRPYVVVMADHRIVFLEGVRSTATGSTAASSRHPVARPRGCGTVMASRSPTLEGHRRSRPSAPPVVAQRLCFCFCWSSILDK